MARDKGPRSQLGERARALRTAAENARGRVSDDVVDAALAVVERTSRRLEISGDNTVVALGGATGSGKSSVFNAVTQTNLATPGVRRPTTSKPLAVTFGEETAEDLLDFLVVGNRHAVRPGTGAPGVLPGQSGSRHATNPELTAHAGTEVAVTEVAVTGQKGSTIGLDGLVLLDLPDHDSTALAHRQEVDRLVELVDVLVWVVDPQKYADAALHDRYLKPLAQYAPVMLVVLNQIDRLSEAELKNCRTDLRRLLDSEGLKKVEIAAVSATTGEGIDDLRKQLAKRVASKQAAASRLATDIERTATALARESGSRRAGEVTRESAQRLNRALATAAGVEVVSEAVGKTWRHRGGLATGWPVLSWLARFKPDPLKRLHLDRWGVGTKGRPREIDPVRVSRTSLPATTSVQQARVDSAVRDLADESAEGLTRGWAVAVRDASRQHHEKMPDQLDRAIATTDLGLNRDRGWWRVVTVLQWLLVLVVVGGLGWLGVEFALLYLQMPPLPEVLWWGLPAPTVLVVGGVIAGLLVALFARIGVEVGARRKERRARSALMASIGDVTRERVIVPVNEELERYELVRENLATALK